jgi:hypothetical protein
MGENADCQGVDISAARSQWVRRAKLEGYNQSRTAHSSEFVDARRQPRFRVEVAIRIYPRNSQVIRGHTVDLSESGVSAMLEDEVPVGELVRVEFTLDFGAVELHAIVRQRTAFRYGFQFLELGECADVIRRSCGDLALRKAPEIGKT